MSVCVSVYVCVCVCIMCVCVIRNLGNFHVKNIYVINFQFN